MHSGQSHLLSASVSYHGTDLTAAVRTDFKVRVILTAIVAEAAFVADPTEAANAEAVGVIAVSMVSAIGVVAFIADIPLFIQTGFLVKEALLYFVHFLSNYAQVHPGSPPGAT